QLVFAAGWNDPHIYAYYVANGYPFGATGGMFCEYPGDAEFGAIALGYDDSNDKYEIVATTLNGWVAVYPIPSLLSSQQSARWDVDVNPSASTALCPPVVGDVDGDGDNDIATGSGSGVLYIIDESSGDILYSG